MIDKQGSRDLDEHTYRKAYILLVSIQDLLKALPKFYKTAQGKNPKWPFFFVFSQ